MCSNNKYKFKYSPNDINIFSFFVFCVSYNLIIFDEFCDTTKEDEEEDNNDSKCCIVISLYKTIHLLKFFNLSIFTIFCIETISLRLDTLYNSLTSLINNPFILNVSK